MQTAKMNPLPDSSVLHSIHDSIHALELEHGLYKQRLGLLRDQGRPVVTPQDWTDPRFPDSWDDLPPVIRLNPQAPAFAAYTTLSVLSPRFLPVELAVRTILSQFAADRAILAEAADRAQRDAMRLPAELVDRIRYVFATPGDTDPG